MYGRDVVKLLQNMPVYAPEIVYPYGKSIEDKKDIPKEIFEKAKHNID